MNGGTHSESLAVPVAVEGFGMRTPVFGLSTTPVKDIKSELRLLLEREMLALVYRTAR
jgi:hypothetical protein